MVLPAALRQRAHDGAEIDRMMRFLRKYIFANAGLKLLALGDFLFPVGHVYGGAICRSGLPGAAGIRQHASAIGNIRRHAHDRAHPRARALRPAAAHGSRRFEPAAGHEGREAGSVCPCGLLRTWSVRHLARRSWKFLPPKSTLLLCHGPGLLPLPINTPCARLKNSRASGPVKTPNFCPCSARLQAGMRGITECPPEGGRYINSKTPGQPHHDTGRLLLCAGFMKSPRPTPR